ncbi:MAG: TonB family protein [Candidatus Obscuribacterales bacterium]|nr:TonB family protein [Candidatus Obscuribacterales bacterium]
MKSCWHWQFNLLLVCVYATSCGLVYGAPKPGSPHPKGNQSSYPAPMVKRAGSAGAAAGEKSTSSATTEGGSKAIKDHYFDIGPVLVRMQQKISKNWNSPKEPKTVTVKWQLLPDGTIAGLRIDKSSGDPACDKAALDSVAMSAPFEPLPKGVPASPITFTFQQAIRFGMEQIPISERAASISLSNSAVDLTNNKQLEEALDKLDFAFERDPANNQIAGILRAVAAYVSDETPDKVHILHRVLALDPQQHAAIEKLRVLHRASGIDPNSADSRLKLGDECLNKRNAEGALAEFSAANAIRPGACPQEKMTEVYRALAGQRLARKWQTSVKVRRDADGLCGLGRAHQLAGYYDEAEKCYKEALAEERDSVMAKNLLAKLEEEKASGVREKIAAPIARHVTGESGKGDLIPKSQLLNNEGVDEMDQGNLDGAAAKFREALESDPGCESARRNLSTVLNNQGTKVPNEEAAGYWRKALFVSPANATAHKNLCSFLKYSGKNPESFDERMSLADSFAKGGDFVSAVVEVREALVYKKDQSAQNKLKDYLKKAPALPK